MERKGYLLSLILPVNCSLKYIDEAMVLSKENGFLAISPDSKNNIIHFIFETREDAIKARINILDKENIAILCGSPKEISFDDKILSKENQDNIKNKSLQDIRMAVELEKMKHDGLIPS